LSVRPWVFSARSEAGLRAQAARLRDFVAGAGELDPADLGWSLAVTRAGLDHRAVVLGSGLDDLRRGLEDVATGQASANVVTGLCPETAGKTAFLCSGQGAQWPGMGRELSASSPAFAAALDEVCAEMDRHLGAAQPLREVMAEGGPLLTRTEWAQ